jgi:integrase
VVLHNPTANPMHFELNHYTKGKLAHIFLVMTLTDGRLKYAVKEQCDPKNWKGGRTKDKGTNSILNRIEIAVTDLQNSHKHQGKAITREAVTNELDILLHRKTVLNGFWEIVDNIITDRAVGLVLTKQGKRFSHYTIRNYRNSKAYLMEFDQKLSFHNITSTTYDRLISFLNSKNHSLNTVGQTVKNLKVFMKQAFKDGYHTNRIFESFIIPEEETFDIFLTKEEIDRIYKHKFQDKLLDLVRDWFIIDCFTGLRISDIKLLDKSHLNGDFITMYNEKTDTRVTIPLNSYVKAIIKKHKGLPRKISDQKMNEHLKEIAEAAKINDFVLFSITKGGIREDHDLLKWQMVSNHSARRSFITNMLIEGIPDSDAMKLTGIKKHSTLMRYKKESELEIAQRMKGHKFFK